MVLLSVFLLPRLFQVVDPFWYGEPRVLPYYPFSAWWIKGYDKGTPNYLYEKTADALANAYENGSLMVRSHYGNMFVNPYNNTIFVVLKDRNEEVKNEFLRIMNPPGGVTVVFREGPALYSDLQKWVEIISKNSDSLKEKGVIIDGYGITENATIAIGIHDMSSEKINVLKDFLRGKVPLVILVFYEMPIYVYLHRFILPRARGLS